MIKNKMKWINATTQYDFITERNIGEMLANYSAGMLENTNRNFIINGPVGSGKTHTIKQIIAQELTKGTKVIVIDPDSEYKDFCNNYKGQYVKVNQNSEIRIDENFQLLCIDTRDLNLLYDSEKRNRYNKTLKEVWQSMTSNDKVKTLLVVEGMYNLIRDGSTSIVDTINDMLKISRKYNAGIIISTYLPSDLLSYVNGKQIYQNCSFKLFLKGMWEVELENIAKLLNLTEEDKEQLFQQRTLFCID
jgi:type IV secretory pathway VirB4 component